MSHSSTPSTVAAQLESALESLAAVANAERKVGAVAYLMLAEKVGDAITALRMDALRDELASLPPIAGGGPDDFEDIDEAIFGDEWPEYPDHEVDGYRYETGPTPLSVLADSDPSAEWDLLPAEWDALESRWTDADQYAAFGHV